MSKIKEHLKLEEIIALFDHNLELLPETLRHIENCDECSSRLKKYESMTNIISANRHISHFPDLEKIERISAASFSLLHDIPIKEEIEESKGSLMQNLISWLKPLALTAGVALFALMIYTNIEKDQTDTPVASVDDTVDSEVSPATEKDYEKVAVSIEPSLKNEGDVIETERAKVVALAQTFIGFVSENEVTMKKGKAKFDIVRGNDFVVNVSDRFSVRVLGTSFILESNNEKFSIDVISGLVEVTDNSDNSVTALTADMNKAYNIVSLAVAKIKTQKPAREIVTNVPKITENRLVVTPEATYLKQGREALNSGRKGSALQLFIMELDKGSEKDKALFELTRIYSNDGNNKEVVNVLIEHGDILNSSRLYKEELLIRGCHAEHSLGESSKSFCSQYLKEFPRGYKRSEIEGLINAK